MNVRRFPTHRVEKAVFWPLPIWVFGALYLVLFAAVVALWWAVPVTRAAR